MVPLIHHCAVPLPLQLTTGQAQSCPTQTSLALGHLFSAHAVKYISSSSDSGSSPCSLGVAPAAFPLATLRFSARGGPECVNFTYLTIIWIHDIVVMIVAVIFHDTSTPVTTPASGDGGMCFLQTRLFRDFGISSFIGPVRTHVWTHIFTLRDCL